MNRVAVIGLGKMGLLHASLLSVIPDVKLAVVCEKSRLISRFSKNAFTDVKIVTDIRNLSQLRLDTVPVLVFQSLAWVLLHYLRQFLD